MTDKTTYAVIQIGAKQYLVKVGDKIITEKIDAKDGDTIKVAEVLLSYDGEKTQIGSPYLDKVSVELQVNGVSKGDKIRVAKFKAKSRYRRVAGHRQLESNLTVKAINL